MIYSRFFIENQLVWSYIGGRRRTLDHPKEHLQRKRYFFRGSGKVEGGGGWSTRSLICNSRGLTDSSAGYGIVNFFGIGQPYSRPSRPFYKIIYLATWISILLYSFQFKIFSHGNRKLYNSCTKEHLGYSITIYEFLTTIM